MTDRPTTPPAPTDLDDALDLVKYGYALVQQQLADLQRAIVKLVDDGKLDDADSMALQRMIGTVAEDHYLTTTHAIRHDDLDDEHWDWADNTYSDGSTVHHRANVQVFPDQRTAGLRLETFALLEFDDTAVHAIAVPPCRRGEWLQR